MVCERLSGRRCIHKAEKLNYKLCITQKALGYLQYKLFDHAIGEILNAQINVVKVLTLKY